MRARDAYVHPGDGTGWRLRGLPFVAVMTWFEIVAEYSMQPISVKRRDRLGGLLRESERAA